MKSGTIKKKKSVRRTKAAPKTVVRQSYILRKRRLLAMLDTEENTWRYEEFKGVVGESDLRGRRNDP